LSSYPFSSACSRDPNTRKQKYLQSGERYFAQGKYQEAAIEFFNAIRIDDNFAEAHYQLAQSYLRAQQWSLAYQELERTVQLQPEHYQARNDLVQLLIAAHDFKQAQEQTDWLLRKRPDDPQVHATYSSLLASRDDLPGAIEEMQKAIAMAPKHSTFYLNLALQQMKSNQSAAAESNFKKALELDPKSPDPSFFLGTLYQSGGRFADADQEFRNAIAADPKNPEFRGALARLYLAQDRKSQAEEYLRRAALEFPSDSVGYRMLGDFYYATGDIDKAIAEYAGIVEKHPKDLQAKKNYIQLLIQRVRFDDAQKLNDEVLKANPQDGEALIYRAQIQIGENHLVEATSTLQMATRNDPTDAAAHYYLGIALEKMGNLANAESEWGEAARLRSDLVDAQLALAGAAMRRGDMSALEEVATRIISLRPSSPDGYALRAVASMNRKLFREAEQDAQRAIDVAPQSAAGYVQLGNLRVLENRYRDASKAYQDGLDRDANSIDALRGLVRVYLSQDELDQAIRTLDAHLSASPNNSDFYSLLGSLLFQNKKDLNAAQAAFRRSVELNRDNIDAWIEMGQVQAAMGGVGRAIATYQEAIKEHPGQADLYLLLGELFEAQHDWTNARGAYQNALLVKPADPLASNNLANVILETGGDMDAALSLAQTARRGLPDSPDVADTLGWIYYHKGAYKSAIGLLQEAIQLAEKSKIPENPDFHYHLGLAYVKTDQFVLARQHLERVLKIKPDYVDGANVRKQLARLQS